MEELHRLHKDVPFGWLLWLQGALSRPSRRTVGGEPQVSYRPKAAAGGYSPRSWK